MNLNMVASFYKVLRVNVQIEEWWKFMIYTVTFNPALDYVIDVNDIKLGELNRTTEEKIFCGGKGINVSFVLKTLGIDSIALGFVAGFTGKEIEKRVKSFGVSTDFINLKNGLSRINVKVRSDKETEINAQGPIILEKEIEEFYHKLQQLQDGDILILAGSIPSSLPNNMYEKILEKLHSRTIRIVVDATNELLKNVLPYHPFLIKPNHHELAEMFQVTIQTEDEIVLYAKKLRTMGACNVLVSMGAKGAILVDEFEVVHKIGVPKGVQKYSVGAGDSMVAGFLAGFMRSNQYEIALKVGTAAGSATAFSEGLATKDMIEKLLSELDESYSKR